jgi:hypothetical protein
MFKKMVLIDPAMLVGLKPTVNDKKQCTLDQQMSDVFNSDMPDDEKAKHYMMTLKSYRYAEHPPKVLPDVQQKILNAVKPDLRIKATRLLKHIEPHMRWSDDGQLVHNSALVSESNVAELLTAASVKNSTEDPIGWEAFAEDIKRADPPHSFITNDRLRRFVRAKRRARTPKNSPKQINWDATS